MARLACDGASAKPLLATGGSRTGWPAADFFARNCLILVVAGQIPSTAFHLAVERVAMVGDRVVLAAAVEPEGTIGAMAISRPYVLLAVDRTALVDAPTRIDLRLRSPDRG